ncbi:MAG: tRNA lysidine(34) synthetase TilS [Candidatus Gastranaerophilales bacterium]|nr:tRNA lysidine(34) synthetase TilS [Candidatus Gastranaerophilales bacterium]
MNVFQKVENFLETNALLNSRKKFLVGFSGGVDSICLLDILHKMQAKYSFKLIAAHLNHNWRAEESLAEKNRAEEFCRQKNINFYTETLSENLSHTELEARKQRYNFFNHAAKKLGADCIFTAHNASDNVETILYRIVKGTGIHGLKGIPAIRQQKGDLSDIFRPLIFCTRVEIENYCKENDLKPNIDSSNINQKYFRNKIRHSLIPELKTYNKNVEDAILRLSEIAADTDFLVSEYIDSIKGKITTEEGFSTNLFVKQSKPCQKKLLIDFLIENKIDYDYKKTDDILSFVSESFWLKSGNTLSLTENKWLFVSSKIIKIITAIKSNMVKFQVQVNKNGGDFLAETGKTLSVKNWQGNAPQKFPLDSDFEAYVDLSDINEDLFLRTRQEGDVFQPLGMSKKTKLKKFLINKGIPEHQRDNILIVATDKEVLWVAGVGISEKIKVKKIPTHIFKII